MSHDDELEIEVIDFNDNEEIEVSDKKTSPYMTKFEYAKVIGHRAIQLTHGEKPKVDSEDIIDPYKIAEIELLKRVIPLAIKRVLPGGQVEIWKISELNIRNW